MSFWLRFILKPIKTHFRVITLFGQQQCFSIFWLCCHVIIWPMVTTSLFLPSSTNQTNINNDNEEGSLNLFIVCCLGMLLDEVKQTAFTRETHFKWSIKDQQYRESFRVRWETIQQAKRFTDKQTISFEGRSHQTKKQPFSGTEALQSRKKTFQGFHWSFLCRWGYLGCYCELFCPSKVILGFSAFAAGLRQTLPIRSTVVFLQLPGVREALAALLTGVQLDASVDLHVRLELVGLPELAGAQQTRVGLFSGVHQPVPVEVLRSPEFFSTVITPVGFDPGVQQLVLLQLWRQQEASLADVTDERPVAVVLPHVVQVKVSLVEWLPADVAGELFVLAVALLMCPQCGAAAEALHTGFTAKRFDSAWPPSSFHPPLILSFVCTAVDQLLVFLQLTIVEKRLPTQITHEWLFHAMNQHMALQSPGAREALTTFITPGGRKRNNELNVVYLKVSPHFVCAPEGFYLFHLCILRFLCVVFLYLKFSLCCIIAPDGFSLFCLCTWRFVCVAFVYLKVSLCCNYCTWRFLPVVCVHVKFSNCWVACISCAPEGFLSAVEPQVSLEVVFESEAESTGLTHEGFIPGVDNAVLQQTHLTLEGFVTLAALEGPFVRVWPLVNSQIACCGEALPAGLAGEGPGTSMDRLVLSEVLLSDEALSADVTHKRLHFGVWHLVVAKGTWGGKSAIAGMALERRLLQSVGRLVHSELPQQSELSVALITAQQLVGVVLLGFPQLVVQLVSMQSPGLVETFVTGVAGEWFDVGWHVFVQLMLLMVTSVTELTEKPLLFVQLPPPPPLLILLLLLTQTCRQETDLLQLRQTRQHF